MAKIIKIKAQKKNSPGRRAQNRNSRAEYYRRSPRTQHMPNVTVMHTMQRQRSIESLENALNEYVNITESTKESLDMLRFRTGKTFLSNEEFCSELGISDPKRLNTLFYTWAFPFLAEEFYIAKTEAFGVQSEISECRQLREENKTDIFPRSRFDKESIRARAGIPEGKFQLTTSCAFEFPRIVELVDALVDFKLKYEELESVDPENETLPFFRYFLNPIGDNEYAHGIEPWFCLNFLKNIDVQRKYFKAFPYEKNIMSVASKELASIVTIDKNMIIREIKKTPEEYTECDIKAVEILKQYEDLNSWQKLG